MSKIVDIEPYVIPYTEANDHDSTRWSCYVRVETSDGVVGWGEAATIFESAARATAAIVDVWHASVTGLAAEPHAVTRTIEEFGWWYADSGIGRFALSAIDIAVWDAWLRERGQDLGSALGAGDRELPVLLSVHATRSDLATMAEEIASRVREIRAIGVKVAFGKRGDAGLGVDLDRDVRFLQLLRSALGADARIMVDIAATLRWSVDDAIARVRAYEESGIFWIEEPLGADDPQGYRALQAAATCAIAYGEREWSPLGYRRLLDTGTVDVVGIDPGRIGGITAFREASALVQTRGAQGNAHAFAGPLLLAAAIPLSAASPAFHQLEIPPHRNTLYNLVRSVPALESGMISALASPGLGVEVDEDAVRAAAC